MTSLPPLELFMSNDWIRGAVTSRPVDTAMAAIVSPDAGSIMAFAETMVAGAAGVADMVTKVYDIGQQVITTFQGGSAVGIAGLAASAIQLLVGRLEGALVKAAAEAQANALTRQWDIARYLVLRRQARAVEIPGGANYINTQPGAKKDWPEAAVPPIPWAVKTHPGVPNAAGDIYDDNGGQEGPFSGSHHVYRRLVLFMQGTPSDVELNYKCFSLGSGGCDAPDDAQIGLSLLTYPLLVEEDTLPWGGGHLVPFVALLTTPTLLHVQVREADVMAMQTRMRAVMREYWRVRNGPPLLPDAVTTWPDGTYTAPTSAVRGQWPSQNYEDKYAAEVAKAKKAGVPRVEWFRDHPFTVSRGVRPDAGPYSDFREDGTQRRGFTPESALISPIWAALDQVSRAFGTMQRFWQCRRACLRHFSKLPTDVQARAKANPDFSAANQEIWGGPHGVAPPPPLITKTPKGPKGPKVLKA